MVNEMDIFEKKLEAFIAATEKKSAIEFVPVLARQAGDYFAWAWVYSSFLTYLLAEILRFRFSFLRLHPFFGLEFIFVLVVSWLFAKVVARSSILVRFTPGWVVAKEVDYAANKLFSLEKVSETKNRTGVLIAIFEKEKQVVVLADIGLHKWVTPDFWAKLGASLAHDFNQKNPGDEFIKIVATIDEEVATKLPSAVDGPNELANHLRRR